jgi:hypothetical protein
MQSKIYFSYSTFISYYSSTQRTSGTHYREGQRLQSIHIQLDKLDTHDIRAPANMPYMATFHKVLAKPKSLWCSRKETRSQHGLLASPVLQVNRILPPNLLCTKPLKQLIHFVKEISMLCRFTRTHIASMLSVLFNACSTWPNHRSVLNWYRQGYSTQGPCPIATTSPSLPDLHF